MSIDERLKHVVGKVERAGHHLSELEREIRAFLDNEPYQVANARDPETRRLIYFVRSVKPAPDNLVLISGDVIQNLMSALDHLAYQLVCSDTGDNPSKPWAIYFPIADDSAMYEAIKGRKLEGAHQDTIVAIDAVKPYKGGNDDLWTLLRLNNIDKHRLLFTVGSQAAGIHLGQLMSNTIGTGWPAKFRPAIEQLNILLMPADKGFPLKEGFRLYIGAVDEQPNPKQQFRFQVALNEPGIAEGKPLIETLQQLATTVMSTVTSLTPRLK